MAALAPRAASFLPQAVAANLPDTSEGVGRGGIAAAVSGAAGQGGVSVARRLGGKEEGVAVKGKGAMRLLSVGRGGDSKLARHTGGRGAQRLQRGSS